MRLVKFDDRIILLERKSQPATRGIYLSDISSSEKNKNANYSIVTDN